MPAAATTSVLPLPGAYQVENALVAAGLAIAVGEDPAGAIAALADLKGVRGRLDVVGEARGALAVVDYAHKPEALEAALAALRPFATGKLICLFGCGGDRDKGKRPIMGRIASADADVVIVTDDNPRSETPAMIRAEILAGAEGARRSATAPRRSALEFACSARVMFCLSPARATRPARSSATRCYPFSDHDEVEKALSEIRR